MKCFKDELVALLRRKKDKYIEGMVGRLKYLELAEVVKNPLEIAIFNSANRSIYDVISFGVEKCYHHSEETRFGIMLEPIVLKVARNNERFREITKKPAKGLDFSFWDMCPGRFRRCDHDKIFYHLQLKSGDNCMNATNAEKQSELQDEAIKLSKFNTVSILGHAVGKDRFVVDKENRLILGGASFWEFLSGDRNFYIYLCETWSKIRSDWSIGAIEMQKEETKKELAYKFEELCCDKGTINYTKLNNLINPKLEKELAALAQPTIFHSQIFNERVFLE